MYDLSRPPLQAARGALRQVDVAGETAALFDERPAIVDAHHDGAALIGHAQERAERQGAVRRRHGVRIEPLAARGVAAGFEAVIRRRFGVRRGEQDTKEQRGENRSHQVTFVFVAELEDHADGDADRPARAMKPALTGIISCASVFSELRRQS